MVFIELQYVDWTTAVKSLLKLFAHLPGAIAEILMYEGVSHKIHEQCYSKTQKYCI